MTSYYQIDDVPNGPVGAWTDRVRYSGDGLAFRPRQLLVSGAEAVQRATQTVARLAKLDPAAIEVTEVVSGEFRLVSTAEFDVVAALEELRERGIAVEPNHVLFAHSAGHGGGCGGCMACVCGGFGANPLIAQSVTANPLIAQSLSANPLIAQSLTANPLIAQALAANPLIAQQLAANPLIAQAILANPLIAQALGANPLIAQAVAANPLIAQLLAANPLIAQLLAGNPLIAQYEESGAIPSSAVPAEKPVIPTIDIRDDQVGVARAFILDTGIAADLPSFLRVGNHLGAAAGDRELPDETDDDLLDAAAGHGTFIAGILERLAPKQDVHVCRVLSTVGDGDVAGAAERLEELLPQMHDRTVVNLSFGTYVDSDMPMLAKAIKQVQAKGAVVVASAGNDGVCTPSYPAAFPDVVSVGSIELFGRAYYSNFGPWVRACAPGTGVVSSFFDYDGKTPPIPGTNPPLDLDDYDEWAQWTGTSFAAPIVTAALMRHIALTGATAQDAVKHIIDGPGLYRHPGLGTVVNFGPGM